MFEMKRKFLDIGLHNFYFKYFLFKEDKDKNFYSDLDGLAKMIADAQLLDENDISRMVLSDKVAFVLSMSIVGKNIGNRYNIVHSFRVGKIMHAYAFAVNKSYGNVVVKPSVVRYGGFYHDVGHVMTPEHVLLKKGALDESEREVLKKHPVNGEQILKLLGVKNRMILDCSRYHHEKFDGSGYFGLAGEDIPLVARMANIVDSYDAIRGKRVYKARVSKEDAFLKIKNDCDNDRCFDPVLFGIFVDSLDDYEYLYKSSKLYENIVMEPN